MTNLTYRQKPKPRDPRVWYLATLKNGGVQAEIYGDRDYCDECSAGPVITVREVMNND